MAFRPALQVDCGYPYFLVVIYQQFGAPIQLVGDIEQMFGQAVRSQARQQLPANPKVYFRALAFGDERIGRLLNSVVEESIRSLQTKNQPGADGFQKRSVDLPLRIARNHTQWRDLGYVPETGELLESGLRSVGNRWSFPSMRSATLSE